MAPQLTPRKGRLARGPAWCTALGDDLLARAALAGDEQGHVGVLDALDERVQAPHRRARADQARVAEVAAQLGARLLQVPARLGQLLGALAEKARDLVARRRELDVRPGQLVGARAVLGRAGARSRSRSRPGPRSEQRGNLLLEAHARARARLDVEGADGVPERRRAADRHAGDRLDGELVDATACARRASSRALTVTTGSPSARPFGDRAREAAVGSSSPVRTRAAWASSSPFSPTSTTMPRSAASSATA